MKNLSQNAGKVLGISISKDSKKTILEYIQKYLKSDRKKPYIIVTPNAEQLVLAQDNTSFAKRLNQADVALPDGFPVAAILGIPRIAGVDFIQDLVTLAAKERVPIGLIGGKPGLAVQALECLKAERPALTGFGMEAPELFVEKDHLKTVKNDAKYPNVEIYLDEVMEKIQKTRTRILLVGLGAPKQEHLIEMLEERSTNKGLSIIFMSVGGSFDVIAGKLKRAPQVFRLIGFEWFWRLLQEPWRWKRQLSLFRFIILVMRERLLFSMKKRV